MRGAKSAHQNRTEESGEESRKTERSTHGREPHPTCYEGRATSRSPLRTACYVAQGRQCRTQNGLKAGAAGKDEDTARGEPHPTCYEGRATSRSPLRKTEPLRTQRFNGSGELSRQELTCPRFLCRRKCGFGVFAFGPQGSRGRRPRRPCRLRSKLRRRLVPRRAVRPAPVVLPPPLPYYVPRTVPPQPVALLHVEILLSQLSCRIRALQVV